MDLEKLQEMADKDLAINETELDLESLKTPQVHNKYMKHYTKFKLMLTKAETDYRQLKKTNGNIIQANQTHRSMPKNHLT